MNVKTFLPHLAGFFVSRCRPLLDVFYTFSSVFSIDDGRFLDIRREGG
jgi:hypothetical protein